MFGWLTGNIVDSVEKVAVEYIKAPEGMKKAESQLLKIIDPNGKMRREISRALTSLYRLYFLVMLMLFVCQGFDLGDKESIKLAIDNVISLFVPVVALMGAVVTATFGVNAMNSHKGN